MGDAKAPTTLGASALRFGQSELGLAPVIKRLPAFGSYWGVGGRVKLFFNFFNPPTPRKRGANNMFVVAIYLIL